MVRTALGAALLVATLLTGLLAGTTRERPARSMSTRPTAAHPLEEHPAPAPPAAPAGGAASAPVEEDGTPETVQPADRTRRPPPELTPEQAGILLQRHGDYKERLHATGMAVAGLLEGDPVERREAVERMRALREERNRFLADLLGPEAYGRWRHIELTGGRSVDEFLQQMQERNR